MNLNSTIFGIIVLILLSVLIWREIDSSKKINRAIGERDTLAAWQDSVTTAETSRDTIHDTIELGPAPGSVSVGLKASDSIEIYRKLKKRFSGDVTNDTSSQGYVYVSDYERTYSKTITTPEFKLPVYLTVQGKLKDMSIGKYEVYRREIHTKKIVNNPIYKYREEKKIHMYLSLAMGNPGQHLHEWNSIDLGVDIMWYTNWALGVGYQRWDGKNLYKIRGMFKIF